MRKSIVLAMTAATAAGVAAFVPAAANASCAPNSVPPCTGDTAVTATVGLSGVGVVSIVPPTAMALAQTGSTLSNAVPGATTVTDTRVPGLGGGSWTVTAKMSDLSLTGASPAVTIPASGNASVYTSSPVVAVPGTATVTDNHVGSGNALALLNTDSTLLSAATTNANSVTYTSTLLFSVPNNTPVGVYTGTLTETVS
jgi:hypothetical protein